MKTRLQHIALLVACVLAGTWLTGCGGSDSADSQGSSPASQDPSGQAASTPGAVDPGKALAAQAQSLLDQAKTLIDQSKYAEVNAVFQQLTALRLTPEQQKLFSDLKAQLQKAMATAGAAEASKAAGNLLKKN